MISSTRKASQPIDPLADERFFEILATVTSHLPDPSHITRPHPSSRSPAPLLDPPLGPRRLPVPRARPASPPPPHTPSSRTRPRTLLRPSTRLRRRGVSPVCSPRPLLLWAVPSRVRWWATEFRTCSLADRGMRTRHRRRTPRPRRPSTPGRLSRLRETVTSRRRVSGR
jgi:hypothetical protein